MERKRGSLGVMGGIAGPGGWGWGLVAGGGGEGGPHSPNDIDQDHELDQAEDDAHLLVAHEYHPGGVILEEEGSQLILEPLRHGGRAGGSPQG